MRHLPLLPTAIVALSVPALVILGAWQLQRAEWKEGLLGRLAANAQAPVIDAPEDLSRRIDELSFRRVRVTCHEIIDRDPTAARSVEGRPGYRQNILCRPRFGEPLMVSLGVGSTPDRVRVPIDNHFIGPLVPRAGTPAFLLVAETPAPTLAAEAPPTLASIPNNHRAYAVQWFLFAGILTVIYGLWLRQRARKETAPPR